MVPMRSIAINSNLLSSENIFTKKLTNVRKEQCGLRKRRASGAAQSSTRTILISRMKTTMKKMMKKAFRCPWFKAFKGWCNDDFHRRCWSFLHILPLWHLSQLSATQCDTVQLSAFCHVTKFSMSGKNTGHLKKNGATSKHMCAHCITHDGNFSCSPDLSVAEKIRHLARLKKSSRVSGLPEQSRSRARHQTGASHLLQPHVAQIVLC